VEPWVFATIFFFYGLAFFSMGLAIMLEIGRGADARLRHALRPLAAFGLVHGAHEWLEMFQTLDLLPGQLTLPLVWHSLRITLLALSFLALGAFGASLVSPNDRFRRVSLVIPLALSGLWGVGLLLLRGRFLGEQIWSVADVWTRYVLAIPSALLASAGLIIQQRAFRQAGMAQFGRDSLWAAVAFAWYGLIGQVFTRPSPLPPSTILNTDLFLDWFGFPVQLLRAAAAIVSAVFVTRFLRSFEVETQRQIAALQAARLDEAERRQALRGELFRRVVSAQEAERTRIARELHDETGQDLSAIALGLRAAASALPADSEKASRHLRQLEGLVGRSLDELERLVADLRPSQLDDLGLPAALRWYASQIQARRALKVSVEVLGEPKELSTTVSTALFRVAQEALNNAMRHAEAQNARVRLYYGAQSASLRVEDDGKGFDPSRVMNLDHPSWGLMGMNERATLLGGRLNLRSQPGEGTQVEVIIPYHQESGIGDEHTVAAGG